MQVLLTWRNHLLRVSEGREREGVEGWGRERERGVKREERKEKGGERERGERDEEGGKERQGREGGREREKMAMLHKKEGERLFTVDCM